MNSLYIIVAFFTVHFGNFVYGDVYGEQNLANFEGDGYYPMLRKLNW